MWGHFKDGVLEACDEMCGKKRGRRSKGDTWWWNEEVKESVSRKKDAHRAVCHYNTEENKSWYKSIKNKEKKTVSKVTREKIEESFIELENCLLGCLG